MQKGSWLFIGLLGGVVFGHFLYDPSWSSQKAVQLHQNYKILSVLSFVGFTIFMGLLKMLILPLIASSIVVAIAGVGDFAKLGRMGRWTIVYYVSTMFIAVLIGLFTVQLIQPGAAIDSSNLPASEGTAELSTVGISSELSKNAEAGFFGIFENLIAQMVPENIFQALSSGQTLSVVVFSIFFAVCLTLAPNSLAVIKFFEGVYQTLMKMVEAVLYIAPLGVFCLLAWSIARTGLAVFTEAIGVYMLTVIIGLALHACLVLPLLVRLFTNSSPLKYFSSLRPALLTAIGTDSSIASLPVTIDCVTEEGGVSQEVAALVLPLGANLNMDGTALYEAVAVVFLAQAFGVELGMLELALVAITATFAAIGAAGIPSAGLVTMIIVIEAVNQSLAGSGAVLIPLSGIGLIIGVDRILDMCRTSVNVWGDAVGALIIDQKLKS